MSDEIKLKQCPFCGKTPKMKDDSGSYGYTPPTVYIKCCNGLKVCEPTEKWKKGKGHYSVEKDARKDVIARWNTRN